MRFTPLSECKNPFRFYGCEIEFSGNFTTNDLLDIR